MRRKKKVNEFFDINKMPLKPGLLLFGISMSRIGNAQSARKCFDYMKIFYNKIHRPEVGLVFFYGDSLYMNSNEKASKLNRRYQNLIHSHKYEFLKILKKHPQIIPKSFSFISWNQAILESKEFITLLGKIHKKYASDVKFRKFVREDIGKPRPRKNEIDFILEEIVILYLIHKGSLKLPNEYVGGNEKWILQCYPGKPLKSEIYLFQQNFFGLRNPGNVYENSFYDLEERKLYDYENIDLESVQL